MYKDILIEKKYSDYYQALRDDHKIYSTYLEIFKSAAVIGCLLNEDRYKEDDTEYEGRKRIPLSAIMTNKEEFECIINVISFIHYSRLGENKILEKIFVNSNDSMTLKQEIAINYARGGIEALYNSILKDADTNEDIIDNMLEVVKNHEEKFSFNNKLGSMEDIIGKFL
jgi:hypothetical protein